MSEGRRHIQERVPSRAGVMGVARAGADRIALVRRAFEAFRRRDLGALVELTDPDIELFAPTATIANDGRCYRGHDGIARYLNDVERVWASLEVAPEKFREAGNHVVALGRVHAQARDGLELDGTAAWVWEVREGKLCWGCVYANPGETFMGLSFGADAAVPSADRLVGEAEPPVRAA